MSTQAELFSEVAAELGEGPVWDGDGQRLLWVDIVGQRVHVTSADGASTRSYETPAPVGAVALQRGGGFLLALGAGFARMSEPDGAIVPLVEAPGGDLAVARMNDAQVDPAGRFFAGTMTWDGSDAGRLYRLDDGGRVSPVLSGIACSNGLAWSADGGTVYYIDTPTKTIARFPFEMAGGEFGERTVHADTSGLTGSPDGMTIDADGNLWVAFWGGWCVRCFAGDDGRLLEELPLPVAHVTSVAFGGEDLRRLHVTSARQGLTEDDLREQPDAGRVHVLVPGVTGVATRTATV